MTVFSVYFALSLCFVIDIASALEQCTTERAACDSQSETKAEKVNFKEKHRLVTRLYEAAKMYEMDGHNLKKVLGLRDKIMEAEGPFVHYKGTRQSTVKPFVAWANRHAEMSGIEIVWDDKYGGFGLVAQRDVDIGEEMIVVDSYHAITTQNIAKQYKCLKKCKADWNVHHLTWLARDLMVEVLSHAVRNESKFSAYINSMPSTYNVPSFFSYEDFVQLNGSIAYNYATYSTYTAIIMYTKAWLYLHDNPDCAKKIVMPLNQFTLGGFLWAYCVVVSRQYNGYFKKEVNKVMLPIYDLINHREPANTHTANFYIGDKDGVAYGDYKVTATEEIAKGEELYNTYQHDMDPREAFDTYGFVSNSYYALEMVIDGKDKLNPLRRQLIKENTDDGYGYLNFYDPEQFQALSSNDHFVQLLQIATAEEAPRYSVTNIRRAWKFLIAQIKHALSQYKDTPERLEKKLQTNGLSGTRTLVLKQLIDEQRLLQKIEEHINEVLLQ